VTTITILSADAGRATAAPLEGVDRQSHRQDDVADGRVGRMALPLPIPRPRSLPLPTPPTPPLPPLPDRALLPRLRRLEVAVWTVCVVLTTVFLAVSVAGAFVVASRPVPLPVGALLAAAVAGTLGFVAVDLVFE
jgi:hypothetical protein